VERELQQEELHDYVCNEACVLAMGTTVGAMGTIFGGGGNEAIDSQGQAVTPAVAAERIVTVLKETRTVRRRADHKVEPLGMRVGVNVEVFGLRGQPLRLSWSVLQRSGSVPLPDPWLSSTVGYRLQPSSDRDTGTLDFWVPLPKASGQYYVSLILTSNGTALTSAESKDFG
jgi:hypothetical protein